ncbi:hypothetical protein LOD99_6454 [Oopsacas minuta]|uniref:Uncharacterized protein n=1 Tax=Oopsacas minuta TaxID=111878 RepID=A0AAV7JLW3_9METZ|nr:hypothetical protein LOD99_6454 [Oopsacas minuta]
MISIWDMIVASGYPTGELHIGIGMGVFAISLLVSLFTLPVIIFLIDMYYSRVQKVTLGGGGHFDKNKQYGYDHLRIVICFLVSVIIFMLLTIVMSVHGIYFLYKMFIDERYLHIVNNSQGQGGSKDLYTYVIPTSHYVLYFLEATHEAAEGNLILWGFLFLVNSINNLTGKEFYFKIFTLLLSLRVIFVFACHFNIWELIINISDFEDDSTIQTLALEAYPFHTFAKLLRVVEILLSLIIFIPLAVYMRHIMINRSNEYTDEDQHGIRRLLIPDEMRDGFKKEMKFWRKYMCGYSVFLLIYLFLNIIEGNLVGLIVSIAKESSNKVELLFAMSVVTDILAYIPSFSYLLFIAYFAYPTTKKGAVKSDNREGAKRHKRKRFLFIGFIILFSSVFCASFIGYLRFTDGDDFRIDFHPGDYILVPPPDDTQLSTFINSCDSVKISGSPSYQLTIFDSLKHYYNDTGYKDINKTRLLFYKDYEKNQKYFNQQLNTIQPMSMWFPADTCFYDITLVDSINYTVIPFPYPCYDFHPYKETSANDGLQVMCSGFENAMKENQETLFCTKNESMGNNNNCCLHKDSVIWTNNPKPQKFTARRPFYMGYNNITDYSSLKNGKLIQFSNQFPYGDKEIFYLTCQYTPWLAVGILVSICLLMGLYLTLSYIGMSIFSLWYFSRSVRT